MKSYKSTTPLILIALFLCSCCNKVLSTFPNESNKMEFKETVSLTSKNLYIESAISEAPTFINEEEALKNNLKSETSAPVTFWDYDDYDGDCGKEAFAFTGFSNGKYSIETADYISAVDQWDDKETSGSLWFVDSTGAQKIEDNVYSLIFTFTTADGTKYLSLSCMPALNPNEIWGVDKGKPVEQAVSRCGIKFKALGNDKFMITQSAFDGFSMDSAPAGVHTYKPYYFYYDNGFYEYGGTELTLDALKAYSGAEQILAEIESEHGVIQSIYARENHLIHINYSVDSYEENSPVKLSDHYYITLSVHDDCVEENERGDGIYLPALVPEIATYHSCRR